VKVPILRHNCETFAYCKLPDGSVTGRAKAALKSASRETSPGDRFSLNRSLTSDEARPALTIGGEGETRLDILLSQVRKITQDLLVCHA